MILIDYSQLSFAAALEHLMSTKDAPSTDLLRHLVLNSIRAITKKYKGTYGPRVVLAMDGPNYWRREVFAHYKAKRKAQRDSSGQDWGKVFDLLNPLKTEFPVSLPYTVLRLEGAEADDVIGCLVQIYAPHEKILIVSSDKDFHQLHGLGDVKQWSPAKKAFVKAENQSTCLKELILRGDTGDGIPNVLSADDVFVTGGRQKPLTNKKLQEYLSLEPSLLPTDVQRNYARNRMLIDLQHIPTTITTRIREAFDSSTPASKQEFLTYLTSHRLAALTECIHEF